MAVIGSKMENKIIIVLLPAQLPQESNSVQDGASTTFG